MDTNTQRLIEHGFPCHQVGAETQRERDTGQAPPVNRLHVWWARRPLTPSRAAIVASLDAADTDAETFVCQLGIERVRLKCCLFLTPVFDALPLCTVPDFTRLLVILAAFQLTEDAVFAYVLFEDSQQLVDVFILETASDCGHLTSF